MYIYIYIFFSHCIRLDASRTKRNDRSMALADRMEGTNSASRVSTSSTNNKDGTPKRKNNEGSTAKGPKQFRV